MKARRSEKTEIKTAKKQSWVNLIVKNRYLLLLLLPGLIYYIIFCYVPMYGALIAFKDYTPEYGKGFIQNIMESPWVGLEHFRRFFGSYNFTQLLRNTLLLNQG